MWVAITVGVALVLFGLFVYFTRSINTTGNTAIWFSGELRSGHFEEAHARLCSAQRAEIPIEEFIPTEGAQYSVFRDQRGTIFGADQQYPDEETLDRRIDEAWTELEIRGAEDVQVVRLNMVREGEWLLGSGEWKVCGIEVRDAQSQ